MPHYHELFSHVGQRGKFQKSHDANTNILTRHMIWVEKLPEGMHWLVKIIKKLKKLLQFAIQTGKYNLVGSHTAVLCLFASHQKTKLNPVRHNKNKKSRNLFLIKKMIFRKKKLAIFEQVLFSGKSSLIYKHSSCPSPSLLQ